MNKRVFLILFILLGLIITGSILTKRHSSNTKENAKEGFPAPSFELKDIYGKTWKLQDFKGKIVILNFWASWCSDCKEEKKSIQSYLNKNGIPDDLVFITIAYKDNPSTVADIIKKNHYTFTVLIDDGIVSSVYGIKGVPETFLIDKNGILRRKIIGPIQWDNPHLISHLRQVLM